MYMKGFRKPVTMRFARFELGRNQWRRYSQPLDRDVEPVVDDDVTTFDVNGIGIEENSQRLPFNYVLPVGIQREQAIGIIQGFQNEQALSMRVCNLRDGDSKAIFKNTRLDMRVYKRMKMFVHAEASDDKIIEPGELSLFIRVGSDFRNNYYEYEVPLTMSDPNVLPPGPSNRDNDEYKREVWRQENEFDFPLSLLTTIKELRNLDQTSLTQEYSKLVTDLINEENKENHRIKIKGNPNTGLVKSVLIGVRNRRDKSDSYCAEVWVNELRLTGLDERGGMAALARLDLQLADFGNVTLSGNYGSIGFGALDQRLAQRAREQSMEYGVATNLELGKFLPEKTGIHIPFYAQYSKNIRVPEFDPYDLDLNFQRKVDTADPAVRDSLLDQALIVTTVKSYNFTNVRKDRTKTGKPMPWDISNFGFTYAYNQTLRSDPLIESDDVENYRAAIDYGFQIQPKYITPFKGLIKKDKWFKLLTDFNFNPLPNSFGVSTIMDRQFAVTKYRFTGVLEQYNTFFNKRFTWDRIYDLQWDLSRALKLDFTANANSVIDEPREFNENLGRFITDTERRDSIWQNVRDFGRMKNYTHSINASYTLPLKQFPLLDWITVRAQYAGNYSWNAAALNTTSLGNVIQNGQNRQVNGEFNFESLYNKWAFLRKINNPGRATNTRNQPRTPERTRQNNTDAPDDNPSNATAKKDDKKKKDAEPAPITRALIRPLMALRRARLNYTETFSTIVPGFTPTSQWLGMSNGFDAPGWDFVAGWQPNIRQWQPGTTDDWLANAANQGWITNDILLNQQVLQNYSQNYDGRITIEPFRDFRIEVEANKQFTENHSQYFKDTLNDGVNDWVHAVPRNFGSMTVSYFAMNTIFKDSNEDIIGLFNQFQANRITISQRLGSGVHGTDQEALQGYTQGYGRAQQEVVIPAFIAAYTKQDASKVSLDIFKTMPRLNWRVTYNGLSRLPLFKEIFQSVNISHGYRSTLTINQFYTGTNYLADPGGLNLDQNYYARIEIPEVVISEQFSPLLAVDVTTKNNMSFKLDFRKARTLGFSFVGNQLSQTQTSEYIVGFGYKMQNVRLSFLPGYQSTKPANNRGRNANTQDPGDQSDTVNPRNSRSQGSQRNRGGQQGGGNDLDLKFDFSLRDDITLIQPLDESGFEPTRGTWALRINPQAQYQLNKRLILIFFVNYTRTVPKVSSSFPITNSQGGVTVRFSLN